MNTNENVNHQFFIVKTVGDKGTNVETPVETLGPCPSPELLHDLIALGGAQFSKDELNAIEQVWDRNAKIQG